MEAKLLGSWPSMREDNCEGGDRFTYVSVAELSCAGTIRIVLESLIAHGDSSSIYLIVPEDQVDEFKRLVGDLATIISELHVLPSWPLSRFRENLGEQGWRAGWYLQQFLKLSFDGYLKNELQIDVDAYVVWDADTVMLKRPCYTKGEKKFFLKGRKIHLPYFDTINRIFGVKFSPNHSFIAQYMYVEMRFLMGMRSKIIEVTGEEDWIFGIIRSLPLVSDSEFSEYETYVSYLEMQIPESVCKAKGKWFLHGSDVISDPSKATLGYVEKRFSGYSLVAFERHSPYFSRPVNILRRGIAKLFVFFRVQP
jgi:hypothetical protein